MKQLGEKKLHSMKISGETFNLLVASRARFLQGFPEIRPTDDVVCREALRQYLAYGSRQDSQ